MTNRSTGTEPLHASQRRVGALLATSLGFAVIQLDVTVVNVAIKQIGRSFGTGVSGLQWTISAYTLTFAAMMLSAGALGDRFGARRMFTIGFFLFVLSSIACGLAPSTDVLISARAVQGCGAALLGSSSLALLNHTFAAPSQSSWALAWWAAGGSTALSGGPVLGGVLIATLGWRAIFFINVPIGAAGLWLTRRCLSETPLARQRRLDPAGSLLASVALTALAGALINAGSRGLEDTTVLAGFAIAVLAGIGFILREASAAEPMLPLVLFRKRQFTASGLIGLFVNLCFYGLIFLFSLLFQSQHHLTPLQTGFAFVPMTAAILACNLLTGRLANRTGAPAAILAGVAAMIISCLTLLGSGPRTPIAPIIAAQVLLGGGLGLLVPPMTGTLMASVDRSRSGIASGALTTMRQTGSLLGIALFGSLLRGGDGFYTGLRIALAISTAALLASAALSLLLASRSRSNREIPQVGHTEVIRSDQQIPCASAE